MGEGERYRTARTETLVRSARNRSLLPSPISLLSTIYPPSTAPRHHVPSTAAARPLTRRRRRAYTRRESAPSCNTSMTREAAQSRTLPTGHGGGTRMPVTARLSKRFYEVL